MAKNAANALLASFVVFISTGVVVVNVPSALTAGFCGSANSTPATQSIKPINVESHLQEFCREPSPQYLRWVLPVSGLNPANLHLPLLVIVCRATLRTNWGASCFCNSSKWFITVITDFVSRCGLRGVATPALIEVGTSTAFKSQPLLPSSLVQCATRHTPRHRPDCGELHHWLGFALWAESVLHSQSLSIHSGNINSNGEI